MHMDMNQAFRTAKMNVKGVFSSSCCLLHLHKLPILVELVMISYTPIFVSISSLPILETQPTKARN